MRKHIFIKEDFALSSHEDAKNNALDEKKKQLIDFRPIALGGENVLDDKVFYQLLGVLSQNDHSRIADPYRESLPSDLANLTVELHSRRIYKKFENIFLLEQSLDSKKLYKKQFD